MLRAKASVLHNHIRRLSSFEVLSANALPPSVRPNYGDGIRLPNYSRSRGFQPTPNWSRGHAGSATLFTTYHQSARSESTECPVTINACCSQTRVDIRHVSFPVFDIPLDVGIVIFGSYRALVSSSADEDHYRILRDTFRVPSRALNNITDPLVF